MFIMFWFVRFTFHFLYPISLLVGENTVICILLVFSCDLSFFCKHFWAYHWIFQVSRKQEKFMRKYFLYKITSYSLLSAISQFSLSLLCVGIICWFVLFFVFFVFCFLFVISLILGEKTRFPFSSILPWNVIVLFSSFHLMSVSLPTICKPYNFIFSGYSGAGEVYEEILFW